MKEKLLNLSIIFVGILSGGILLFVSVKYILPVLLPFIIAGLVVVMIKPASERLSKKAKIPERVLRLMMSLFVTLIAVSAVTLVLWQATAAVWHFLSDIGEGNRLYELLMALMSPSRPIFGDIFPEELALRISETLGSLLSGALSSLASGVTSIAAAVPQAFLFIIVTLISLIYFALDYDRISRFAVSLLPGRAKNFLSNLRRNVAKVAGKYLRSYSLIMLITYATLLVGFFLLGVKQAPIIALFVAFLDILPVIGVGTVLVPWSVFELATGNKFLGIGLLVLFIVNALIRQISEPKIVGKSLDLHPIITLMLLYVGYDLFGFAGMILLPMLAVGVSAALKKDSAAEVG